MTGIDWHLHPMMVHFPIALFISAMIFEAVSLCLRRDILHRTALHIYTLAAILTPLAVQTGLWEAEELNLHHPVLEIHERFALWTMWLALVSLPVLGFTLKKFTKAFRPVFIIFLIAIVACLTVTAYNGGRMVFEYGVGVGEEQHD